MKALAARALCCAVCLPLLLSAQAQSYTNSIGMEFVQVPAGSFVMGKFTPVCPAVGAGGNMTESQRSLCLKLAIEATREGFKVEIRAPFSIGRYEVTQEQYQKVMGGNPSYHTQARVGEPADNYPVDSISWQDTVAFVRRLNALENTKAYRLPTEAEWEYAAWAGTTDFLFDDEDRAQVAEMRAAAWFMDNAAYKTHPVGHKKPNPWGLCDTLGNVWEWVQDYYDNQVAPGGPAGPSSGKQHVLKGGSFQSHAKNVRVPVHAGGPGSVISTGFRVLRDVR